MSTINVAIPAYDESEHLPHTLESLARQSCDPFTVWICVNEPERTDRTNPDIHASNLATLAFLNEDAHHFPFRLRVFNQLGQGKGVGWARNFLAEHIIDAHPKGITICLDADTTLEPDYINNICEAFNAYPKAVALAAPYYHRVPQNPLMARNLLRYECYMRYYQVQLWEAGSPYSYLALGSAMAYRHKAWRAVRGIPERLAAEDFYFLQKLRKIGDIIRWIPSTVFPASRFSERVPFGTGMLLKEPCMDMQESRFPFFPKADFQMLKDTFDLIPTLFEGPIPLPIDSFLSDRLNAQTPFDRIRQNTRTPEHFKRGFHQYFDGLRTLQFLRYEHSGTKGKKNTFPVDFSNDPIENLEKARNDWAELEKTHQKNYMTAWPGKDPMSLVSPISK